MSFKTFFQGLLPKKSREARSLETKNDQAEAVKDSKLDDAAFWDAFLAFAIELKWYSGFFILGVSLQHD